ncbi:ABC-type branched-chain amino acid transport system, periplasmic component [Halapricum desulfuricans]|uniref:ABC-type branched-chain amino acid transport system, periplasmic component n=1 Tax=Halapricum desulfuricans TaxID=2841257 RepID=A0A897NRX7_9EURY|nr:ABC transporter substrate-binding protein [Halapricum desulfuricans]QSG12956.1 ABC-type branched-chain amino acid transport system, periplasmic component [Halapricum desulfuricans]
MSNDSGGYGEVVNRRQFIRVAGATGAAALAGCSGGGGGNGDDDEAETITDVTPPGQEQVYDTRFVSATNNGVPANYHLNPDATQNYDDIAGSYVFERFAGYNFQTQEFELVALEDWSVDNETFTLTIREDLNWDNGDPVTARDLITQFRLQKKTDAPIWDFAESVEEGEDEKTVVFTLESETNPRLLKHAIGGQLDRIYAHHPTFEQFLDQDASGIQGFAYEDDVIGNGPFSFESKDKQSWKFTRNDEYADADYINFEEVQLLNRGENTALQQGLRGGELDGMHSLFAPPNIANSMPDHVQEINTPAKWGYGIVFNHDHEHFGKIEVRKAIAHVINREAVAGNAGPRTKATPDVITGIAVDDQERWLGDDMDAFETYGQDSSQEDKAASLLRDAGYTKSGGKWQDGDGNTISADYATPAGWTDWTTATDTVVDQLNSFGFDLQINSAPMGDFYGNYIDNNFALGAFYWLPGGARSSFPFYPLRWEMQCPDIDAGHAFPTGEKTIPGMDGGEMTINPLEEIQTVAQMSSDEEATDTIRRVAWHHNQTLPFVGVTEKQEQTWLSSDDFNTPASNDPVLGIKWASQYLPRTGKLSAKD